MSEPLTEVRPFIEALEEAIRQALPPKWRVEQLAHWTDALQFIVYHADYDVHCELPPVTCDADGVRYAHVRYNWADPDLLPGLLRELSKGFQDKNAAISGKR